VIRVGIVDDQPLVRTGFRAVLGHVDDVDAAWDASDGEEAVALARADPPDVVLMDIRMPRLDGIEATARILADARCAGVRVIILTTFDLDEHVFAALRAGASAFLLKDAAPEALVDAVRTVAGGDALLAPSVTRRLIERFADEAPADAGPLAVLTEREREVLALVARGMSKAELAHEIHVSAATAKTHVGRLLAKLHARDRAQLVVVAYETGLVRRGTPRG
jgi:DNA-binding NarL/FixJ family response regulator